MSVVVTISQLKLQPPLAFSIKATLLYREAFATSWITIASNVNVDTNGNILGSPLPSISIAQNTRYVLRADNEQCETFFQEEIMFPCGVSCQPGYTLSPDSSYCYKINSVAPTPPSGSPATLIAVDAIQYTTCGSYIYAAGYNVNGTGTSNQITTANPFWVNGAGACADNNTSDGALNRCGVWASSTTSNQDIGFSVCINILTAKIYYIGIACDNYGTIKVDGVTVVMQNESAVNTQYGITGACFKVWSIFPVALTAGIHFIEMYGHNVSGIAGFGAEIYNNTAAQIIAATSYGALDLIFSTKDEVGSLALLGTDGYSCPSGYSLAACDSPILCKQIITADTTC